MTSKPKDLTTSADAQYPRKGVRISGGSSDEDFYANHAALTTSPELAAYRAIYSAESKSGLGDGVDVPSLMKVLRDQAKAINSGDMSRPEAMLANQATALQNLFSRLTEEALNAGQKSKFEAYMRMALRAQSQCRTTLETLSKIKNPPVIYAKQANIAHGHQQVNNGVGTTPHMRETETAQNQLSGESHELLPDAGTQGNEGQADPSLEAMGEVDGAKIGRR